MARPSRATPASKRHVTLPDELWDWVDSLSTDALRGKPTYGFRAQFFERLVREERNRRTAVAKLGA